MRGAGGHDAGEERGALLAHARAARGLLEHRALDRDGVRDRERGTLRARAQPELLTAAVEQRTQAAMQVVTAQHAVTTQSARLVWRQRDVRTGLHYRLQ